MLTHLTLDNFRAFEYEEIDLCPITVFLGPNNAGKSSILSAIRLLAQTSESPDRDVPLLLNGPMGDFGTYRDIVYRNHRGRPFKLMLTFVRPFTRWVGAGPDNKPHEVTLALTYKYRAVRRELILKDVEVKVDRRSIASVEYIEDSEKHILRTIGKKDIPSSLAPALSRSLQMFHFIPDVFRFRTRELLSQEAVSQLQPVDIDDQLRVLSATAFAARQEFQSIEYLGAMRAGPLRNYLFSGEKRRRIGAQGEAAAAMLARDSTGSARGRGRLLGLVSNWFSKSGTASKVSMHTVSDRHYELRFDHPVTGESENIADVGVGISQVLPVLVAGYSLKKDDIFLVEEPEIHLHPRAQAELGDFFIERHDAGIQSILETHSEHLILRLQQHVAAKTISPDKIAIYYVYPIGASQKRAKRLRLDEKGKFIDEWPEGFFPERLNEATRLAQIRHGQLSLTLGT